MMNGDGVAMLPPVLPRMSSKDVDRSRQQLGSQRRKGGDSFNYNARVAVALGPCVALVLGMGEKPSLGVLTVGLMLSYILDVLQMKHGAFFSIWATLAATVVSIALLGPGLAPFASWPLNLLAHGLVLELVFLVGVWISLQFRWIQLENPSVVIALERVLLGCIPFVAGPIQTWGIISAVGLEHAAFYLMAIQFVLYWMFCLPLPSSFGGKSDKTYGGHLSENARVMGPLEGCFQTLVLLYLPLFVHIGTHHSRLFTSVDAICELLLLFFVPLLFQLIASARGALWWLAKDPAQLHKVRVVNGAIAFIVILFSLEIRVIFHSFGQYIPVSPPWNYVLVTATLIGVAAAKILYDMGMIKERARSYLLTSVLMLILLSASLAVGLPLKFSITPVVSAFCLSQFFTKRSLINYFIAILSASAPVTWFIVHNFWFLNVWVGGVPLKYICKLIISSALLAMVIPGLMLLPRKLQILAEIGFISQAVLICNVENRLYNYVGMYDFGFNDDVVYPSYMVILTSMIGILVIRRMMAGKLISSVSAWVLYCLYLAKLSMLLLSSETILWASVVLLLSISPPFFFYREKAKGGSKMKPWQGYGHAAVSLVAVWFCRSAIYEALEWVTGRSPSAGLLLGSLVSMSGLAIIPIVIYHFSHLQILKKILVVILGTGFLLIFMQPTVPKSWKLPSYSDHVFGYPDSEAIYGVKLNKPIWPTWLLLIMLSTSLGVLTSAIPLQHSVELRLLYALGLGAGAGAYFCAELFLPAPAIYGFVVIASMSAVVFLIFLHFPSESSPRVLPWVFGLFVSLLPIIYFIEGHERTKDNEELVSEDKLVAMLAIEGCRMSLLGLYAASFMLIALEVKFKLASLVGSDADKNRGKSSFRTGFPSKKQPTSRRLPSVMQSFTIKNLAAEGTWIPAFGNFSTVLCFGLCVLLNFHLYGGSDRAIFFLAPILLLLNQDLNLIMGFGDRQRYFPVTVVISSYLILSAAYKVWLEVRHGYQNADWGLEVGGPGVFYALKNAVLLLLTIPNHFLFSCFMWNYVRQKDFLLLLTTPLNFPSLVATDQSTIRALGLLSIIFALVQYLVSRRVRLAGMKYI